MSTSPPDRHIDAARRRLGHLAGLAAKTEAAEKQILASAQSRLEAVDRDLNRLRPRAVVDDDAGEQFETLTRERGQLQNIIAQSNMVLEQ
jgi:hypothetical protein